MEQSRNLNGTADFEEKNGIFDTFSARLSKLHSTRPDEIFEGRHFPVKKKQYFMNFLKFFRKKLLVCLSKNESTFTEEVPAGKNKQFFEKISREKVWTKSEI